MNPQTGVPINSSPGTLRAIPSRPSTRFRPTRYVGKEHRKADGELPKNWLATTWKSTVRTTFSQGKHEEPTNWRATAFELEFFGALPARSRADL
jgi:hypothetical protein